MGRCRQMTEKEKKEYRKLTRNAKQLSFDIDAISAGTYKRIQNTGRTSMDTNTIEKK